MIKKHFAWVGNSRSITRISLRDLYKLEWSGGAKMSCILRHWGSN